MRLSTRPFACLCVSAMLALPVIAGQDAMLALSQDEAGWNQHAGHAAEPDDAATSNPDQGYARADRHAGAT